jgi:hypothetical protein
MELGRAIAEHALSEEQLADALQERMEKVISRSPTHGKQQLTLPSTVPSFSVTSFRFRRVGNFSDLLVVGKRADDTEEHDRIWFRSAKRNKTDKPNIVRAAEICFTRVAEDILLNKPLN